jgi:fused signal recognition particle receptor
VRFWRRKREEPVQQAAEETELVIGEEADEIDEAPEIDESVLEVEAHVEFEEEDDEEELREQTEQALTKTKGGLFGRISGLFRRSDFGEELWEELEDTLISADTGMATTEEILGRVRNRVSSEGVKEGEQVRAILRDELIAVLEEPEHQPLPWESGESTGPSVMLIVGVNGAGKTTTIAKLAHAYESDGASVILAAADTFRAAAIDQLKTWGDRAGVRVIAHQPNSDPGAVVYDAISAAQSGNADVVIVDTAGRLHTKFNLMDELKKIRRIIERLVPEGPHATILVLDATTGQNGLMQAKSFTEAVGVTGIALAKLDGTSKGGIVFAIAHELDLPVLYIGTGEKLGDLAPFSATAFVDALLA